MRTPSRSLAASLRSIRRSELRRFCYLGVPTGETLALSDGTGDALGPGAVGEGLPGAMVRGNCSALKSVLLMTKMPSRSSTRANQFPWPAAPPMDNLWELLSSGDVVKVIVSCGFSKPCCGCVGPIQRTACRLD